MSLLDNGRNLSRGAGGVSIGWNEKANPVTSKKNQKQKQKDEIWALQALLYSPLNSLIFAAPKRSGRNGSCTLRVPRDSGHSLWLRAPRQIKTWSASESARRLLMTNR